MARQIRLPNTHYYPNASRFFVKQGKGRKRDLPFWEQWTKFFNIHGPNVERVEFNEW